MNHDIFNRLLEDFQSEQVALMASKNEEYAPNADKLSNFKKGANALGVTPEECLWGYAMKHIISIQDIIKGESGYTPERLREKTMDLCNYAILLEAVMQERHT